LVHQQQFCLSAVARAGAPQKFQVSWQESRGATRDVYESAQGLAVL